ncbi:MAG: class I SAM-dependent methyltransferase [Phycisphaerales bacterium]|nr:class I SAM-dependent methyltransferase [Phycisphaerales bacterium]
MAAFEFDDWFPLDDEDHQAQVAGLLDLLADGSKRILDIGCGDGRVLKPLADAGHIALGLDTDPRAVEACARKRLDASVGDALDPDCDLTVHGAPPDAVLCLGHTFMLLTDPVAVLAMLARIRGSLAGGGFFAIDAFCEPLWREVSEGYWQSGVAEDGQSQLVWAPGDNVLAFRGGDEIDEDSWEVKPTDRPMRLWSKGELRLLARAAGFIEPEHRVTDCLIVMRAVR